MSESQRVVIDTSTLIGAVLRPTSTPRQAFLAAVRHFELCVSHATLNELQQVLNRRSAPHSRTLMQTCPFQHN